MKLAIVLWFLFAISSFYVGCFGQSTEIKIEYFDVVHPTGKSIVQIAWNANAVGSSVTNGHFMVQKSADGKKWFRVKIIPYQLYPNLPVESFKVTDTYLETHLFYRLVMRDVLGKAKLLGTAKLERVKALTNLQAEIIMPIKKVYFTYKLEKEKSLLIRIYDKIGQQIFTSSVPSGKKGDFDFLLDCSKYPKGIYLAVFTQVEDNLTVAEKRIEWPGTIGKSSNVQLKQTQP